MIMFVILLVSLLALAIMTAVALLLGGAGILVVFGDLIVCALIIAGIVRLFKRKK